MPTYMYFVFCFAVGLKGWGRYGALVSRAETLAHIRRKSAVDLRRIVLCVYIGSYL